jgi:hypothetical protein
MLAAAEVHRVDLARAGPAVPVVAVLGAQVLQMQFPVPVALVAVVAERE